MEAFDSSAVESTVKAVLTRFSLVTVGYIFGSACTGQMGPLSDIDVAILVHDSAGRRAYEGDVQDALSRALGTDRIDLISLTEAPASLSYRIIRDGRCVLCRERVARETFETNTIMRYLDFKPIRDMAFRTSRRGILEAA
jgi:predicted nucleotidyltransferase